MNSPCGMCGERESNQELCRTDNLGDRWSVCSECAQLMLTNANLAGIWQRTDHQGSSASLLLLRLPVSPSTQRISPC